MQQTITTLFLLLFLAACAQEPPLAGDAEVTAVPFPPTPAYTLAHLETELQSLGLIVETADSFPPIALSPPVQQLRVNKEFVNVHVYADTATAVTEAAWIDPTGDPITRPDPNDPNGHIATHIEWIGTPHWFYRENLIVFYAGDTQSILNGLETVLGSQIAGRETVYPTDSVPLPTATAW